MSASGTAVFTGDPLAQRTPVGRGRRRPEKQADHSDEEQDALDEVRPGDGAETAEGLVDHDHQHEDHDAHPVGDGLSTESGDHMAHRHELRQEVVGDRDHEDAVGEIGEGG
jgi:hypothetical protein